MPQRFATLFFSLLTIATVAPAQTKASLWLTTPDGSSRFAPQKTKPHFTSAPAPSSSAIIDIDDAQKFQSIDGFGYALTGGSAQLLMRMSPAARAAILHRLFSTKGDSIGVSYLRVSIGSSDMNDHVFTYDDLPPGQTDPDLKHFNLGPDLTDVIPILKQILAIAPHIKILASPWSAPAWMKTNGDPKAGELSPEFYPAYAAYFVRYLNAMQQQGVPIDALTKVHDAFPAKNIYFTEQMVIDQRGGTATTNISKPFADIVIGATRNWSRNVLLWNLAADPNDNPHTSNGGCPLCQGAITLDGDHVGFNRGFYTLAHAAKFVRPGSVRIASTEPTNLPNAAFHTREGHTVLLIANTDAAAKTFTVHIHQRLFTTSLPGGAIATYLW